MLGTYYNNWNNDTNNRNVLMFREKSYGLWGVCKYKRKKISFANPEVTDWFVYKFICSTDPLNEEKQPEI